MEKFLNTSVVALDAAEMETVVGGDSQVLYNLGYSNGQAARDFVKMLWLETLPLRTVMHI